MIAWTFLLLLVQAPSPPAQAAYDALGARDYDRAITLFREAIRAAPASVPLRKDLAYTLLKVGDTEGARDAFGEASRLAPGDVEAALEYAFLCFETRRRVEARRIFARLAKEGNATAAGAFRNIDRPLEEGIARWSEVVRQSPDNLSARRELARLAEEREENELAAANYLAAWRLRPSDRDLLLGYGRAVRALGREEEAAAALLAASRGSSPRAADEARELLPQRYPYVPEFRAALALDPANAELRRELAYLLLAMGRQPEAEAEFARALEYTPGDRLSAAQFGLLLLGRGEHGRGMKVLDPVLAVDDALSRRIRASLAGGIRRKPAQSVDLRTPAQLGDLSYKAGLTRDALKHFTAAYERDPFDFDVMLKLGWTLNVLRDDERAAGWFRLASKSSDPAIAAEAARAYRNLKPARSRFRTTVWAYPIWSSRWHDAFSYAQGKTELRGRVLRPYLSVRFIGNTRQARETPGGAAPQHLSETAFVFAGGIATRTWRGAMAWAEAGEAVSYVKRPGRATPDYRGGIAYARHFGSPLGGEAPGLFAETSVDGVFLSRFDNDVLAYWQTRAGYTLPQAGALRWQVLANANLTADLRGQAWANVAESGPGVRFRLEPLPATFSASALRGAYTRPGYAPRRANFYDLRFGIWYAFSR